MKLLLVSVLVVVLPALQGSPIPSECIHKDDETLDESVLENIEDFFGPLKLEKDEGVGCWPCKSPQVFEGKYFGALPKMNITLFSRAFSFDGDGKRMRVLASVNSGGETYKTNTIILAEKKMMYVVNLDTGKCTNATYDKPWQPAGMPLFARYHGTAYLAGEAVANQGLLLDFYSAKMVGGTTVAALTRHGCWGAFEVYNSTDSGPVQTMFLDFKTGIKDPSVFNIPKQCLGASEKEV